MAETTRSLDGTATRTSVRVGAHVSAAGGLPKAVERAVGIGADCVQIFISAPQQWREASHKDADVAAFRAAVAEHGLDPVVIHAIYLLNLASPNEELRQRSVATLVAHLRWSDRIGSGGVIFHPGSHTGAGDAAGAEAVVASLRTVLAEHTGQSTVVLETTSGSRGSVGGRFEQLGQIIQAVGGDPRLRVCLDTAHVFEAGYPCTTAAEVAEMMASFDRAIGLDRLEYVHVNDSKTPFDSRADRHANIGEGHIGVAGFWHLLQNPALRARPLLLEVPGFDGDGPDALNIQLVRAIAAAESVEDAEAQTRALLAQSEAV